MNRLLRRRTGGLALVPTHWLTTGTPKIIHVDRARTQTGRTAVIVRTPNGWRYVFGQASLDLPDSVGAGPQ